MASRDVELVIKAKDDSSKVLDSITKALNDLAKGINDTGKTVDKGDATFARLGKSLSGLDKALKGLSSADKLSQQLSTATTAADKLEKSLTETDEEIKRLSRDMVDAAANTQKYTQRIVETDKALEKEKKNLKDAAAAHKALNADLREAVSSRSKLETAEKNLSATLNGQQERLQKYKDRVAALAAEMQKTDEPTKRLANSFAAAEKNVGQMAAKVSQTESALAANRLAQEGAAQAQAEFEARAKGSAQALDQQRVGLVELSARQKEQTATAKAAAQAEAQLAKAYRQANDSLASQWTGLIRADEALEDLRKTTAQAEVSMKELAQAAKGPLTEAYRAQQSVVSRINNAYQENRKELATLSALMGQVGVPTREMSEAMNRLNSVSRETQTTFKQQSDVLARLRTSLNETAQDSDQLAAKQRQFSQAINQGAQSLSAVQQNVGKATASSQRLVEANRQAQQSYERTAQAARVAGQAADEGGKATDRASEAYRRHANASRQAMSWVQRLRGEVHSLIAAYGGIYAVINVLNQTVEAYKTLEAAQSRLNALRGNDQVAVGRDLDFVRRQADRLGIQFGVLAQEYTKFAASTANTVIEGRKTRDIFLSIAEAGRVNKLSLDDMGGIFKAVIQIASKGKFQLEELSGQLGDRLPGALQILADGLGITVKELLNLTKQGQVASDKLVNFAEELDKRYGGALAKSLTTLTTAMGRLQNAAFEALLAFGNGGFLEGFQKLVESLTRTLRDADFQAFAASVSSAFGVVAKALALGAENFRLVAVAISALVAIKIAPWVTAMIAGFGRVSATATATGATLSAAATAANAATGPMGRAAIAATALGTALRSLTMGTVVGVALTAVAAGITLWATEADKASKAMEVHRTIVDNVRNAYDSARGAVVDWGKELATVTETEAKNNLNRLIDAATEARKKASQAADDLFASNSSMFGAKYFTQAAQAQIKAVEELVKKFREGEISLDDYKNKLDEISKAAESDVIADRVGKLIEESEAYRMVAKAVSEAELIVKAKTGTDKEAAEAMDELTGAAKDLEKQSDDTGEASEAFTEAIEKMTGVVDKASGALAGLKEKLKLDEAFAAAVAAAQGIDQLSAAMMAYNNGLQALSEKDASRIFGNASTSMEASKALLRDREGFRDTAYWDKNAWRTGYGSDTVTLDDGSIRKVTQSTRTTVELANRDLERRIGEFQSTVKKQIGPGRFGEFNPQQQAALTSIAYNYGSLPDRIIDAVRTGSASEISSAIRGLGGDNEGVNRGRRNLEASVFSGSASNEAAEKAFDKRREAEEKSAEKTKERIAGMDSEISKQELINAGKAREAAIQSAIDEAKKENPAIAQAELDLIAQRAGKLFDEQQVRKDIKNDAKEAKQAEQEVNALLAQRNALQQQYRDQAAMGDSEGAEATKTKLGEINTELENAITNAIAMWQAIGGPAADAAITRLETARIKAADLGTQAKTSLINWQQVGELFGNGLVNAFDRFAQAVANGESVGKAAMQAFLQFASEFLIEIGKMIIKQAIFNMLRGFGGIFSGVGLGAGHTGGMIGSKRVGSGNQTRNVNPAIFATASRFHTGGFPGLRPGEVPIIAKEGEEILSENDPRNLMNGGAAARGAAPQASGGTNVRIINSFDSADVVSQGLSSTPGEEAFINVVRSNRGTIRDILEHG